VPPCVVMAPSKRARDETAAVSKRSKPDPMLEGISSAVMMSDLPTATKEMLLKLVPLSFSTPKDQRHEMQAMVVKMVGEILEELQRSTSKHLASKIEASLDVDRARDDLESVVARARESKSQHETSTDACMVTLADITQELVNKRGAMAHAREMERVSCGLHVSATSRADATAAALQAHLDLILGGECEKTDAEAHLQALMPFIEPLHLDSSLCSALHSSCTKKSAERGSFDVIVLQAVENALLSHLAALRDALPKSSVAAVEGAEVARAACVTYEEWREKQRWAADAYSSAQKELRHASDAVSSATEAVAACESEQTAAKQELDQVKAELDSFNSWNMECFRMLRDRLSKKAESQEKDTSAPVPAENLVATQVLEAGA